MLPEILKYSYNSLPSLSRFLLFFSHPLQYVPHIAEMIFLNVKKRAQYSAVQILCRLLHAPPQGMQASVLMFQKTCVLFSDEIHIYRVQFLPLPFYSEFFSTPLPPLRFLLKFYPFDCIAPTIDVQTFSVKIEIFLCCLCILGYVGFKRYMVYLPGSKLPLPHIPLIDC